MGELFPWLGGYLLEIELQDNEKFIKLESMSQYRQSSLNDQSFSDFEFIMVFIF